MCTIFRLWTRGTFRLCTNLPKVSTNERLYTNEKVYTNESIPCGRVEQIAMNCNHALLLCSDGSVKSIGSNVSGELGLGHENEVICFNKIDQFDSMEVIKVQAGLRSNNYFSG